MHYIGIDPGASGGVAIVDRAGHVVDETKMLEPRELHEWLVERLGWYGNHENQARAVLERVSSSPQMGVASSFTFGRSYGRLEMLLAGLAIPYDAVVPRVWQPAVGVVYPKGKPRDKNISKARAAQLFPRATITHANADALLLAEYCRRQEQSRGKEKGRKEKGRHAANPVRESSEWVRETFVGARRGGKADAQRSTQSTAARHGAGPQPKTR